MHTTLSVASGLVSVPATGWRRHSAALGIALLLAACGGDPASPSIGPAARFASVTAGLWHTCAVTEAGAAYCWGANEYGRLGTSDPMDVCSEMPCSTTPRAVAGGRTFTTLALSEVHTCGLSAGAAWCWGFGVGGQLGDGARENSVVPRAVSGGRLFTQLASGSAASCGLATLGQAFCWGSASGWQLSGASVPVAVAGGLSVASLGIGGTHACALSTAGDVYCWGNNWFGQLGIDETGADGGLLQSQSPVLVHGGLKFDAVAVGGAYACALTSAGAAYCWGWLGTTSASSPTRVPGDIVFTSLTAGYLHACGVAASGAAYCWGSNMVGQLGDGTTQDRDPPQPVGGNLAFTALSAGGSHTCGITSDRSTYCWGSDYWGQLGRGFAGGDQVTPVPVVAPTSP